MSEHGPARRKGARLVMMMTILAAGACSGGADRVDTTAETCRRLNAQPNRGNFDQAVAESYEAIARDASPSMASVLREMANASRAGDIAGLYAPGVKLNDFCRAAGVSLG